LGLGVGTACLAEFGNPRRPELDLHLLRADEEPEERDRHLVDVAARRALAGKRDGGSGHVLLLPAESDGRGILRASPWDLGGQRDGLLLERRRVLHETRGLRERQPCRGDATEVLLVRTGAAVLARYVGPPAPCHRGRGGDHPRDRVLATPKVSNPTTGIAACPGPCPGVRWRGRSCSLRLRTSPRCSAKSAPSTTFPSRFRRERSDSSAQTAPARRRSSGCSSASY